MAGWNATTDSILELYSNEGHQFNATTLATAAHYVATKCKQEGNIRDIQRNRHVLALVDSCVHRVDEARRCTATLRRDRGCGSIEAA